MAAHKTRFVTLKGHILGNNFYGTSARPAYNVFFFVDRAVEEADFQIVEKVWKIR
jgi:hypothetical protein